MYEGPPRSRAQTEYRRRAESPFTRRPDRIALWAVGLAVVAMIAGAASAHAGSGGTTASGGGGTGDSGSCPDMRFGARALKLGDCGDDVRTLPWLRKSDAYRVSLDKDFDNSTDNSVRSFQQRHTLDSTGVVRKSTRKKIASTMTRSTATWYGRGMWGRSTACGKTLRRSTIGVANRRLPCGTRVTFKPRTHFVSARVIDRGPYTKGVCWDL